MDAQLLKIEGTQRVFVFSVDLKNIQVIGDTENLMRDYLTRKTCLPTSFTYNLGGYWVPDVCDLFLTLVLEMGLKSSVLA